MMTESVGINGLGDWNKIKSALINNPKNGEQWSKLIDEFKEIEREQASQLNKYRHAAHALIWSKNESVFWDHDLKAAVLMQLRFDGCLGFPGGFIEKDDKTWHEGLNRELKEEMDIDASFCLTDDNYFFSAVSHQVKLVLHMYVKEVSLDDFAHIEKASIQAKDFGSEVMGIVRPPFFITSKGRGFSCFIKNQFVGNALIQLLKVVHRYGILSADEIIAFINQ